MTRIAPIRPTTIHLAGPRIGQVEAALTIGEPTPETLRQTPREESIFFLRLRAIVDERVDYLAGLAQGVAEECSASAALVERAREILADLPDLRDAGYALADDLFDVYDEADIASFYPASGNADAAVGGFVRKARTIVRGHRDDLGSLEADFVDDVAALLESARSECPDVFRSPASIGSLAAEAMRFADSWPLLRLIEGDVPRAIGRIVLSRVPVRRAA